MKRKIIFFIPAVTIIVVAATILKIDYLQNNFLQGNLSIHNASNSSNQAQNFSYPNNKSICKALIPNFNSTKTNRYNVIFINVKFNDFSKFQNLATSLIDLDGKGYDIQTIGTNWYQKVYGFFGTEPFKSNKDKFNFWYVDKSYNSIDAWEDKFAAVEQCKLSHNIGVFLIDDVDAYGAVGYGVSYPLLGYENYNYFGLVTLFTKDKNNNDLTKDMGFEFLHELAHVFNIHHFDQVISDYPSDAISYAEAKSWWGDLIGQGCGVSNKLDCMSDCYTKNQCGIWDYETEVGYFTSRETLCFDANSNPLKDCGVVLSRAVWSPQTLIRNIAFYAMAKEPCQNGTNNCVYRENNSYHFENKEYNEKFICDNSVSVDVSSPSGFANYNCIDDNGNFRPQIHGSMTAAKYNMVYVRYICEQMGKELGDIGGICSHFFTNASVPRHIDLPILQKKWPPFIDNAETIFDKRLN